MASAVWHPKAGTGEDLSHFANHLLSVENITSFLVIGPEERDWNGSIDLSTPATSIDTQIVKIIKSEISLKIKQLTVAKIHAALSIVMDADRPSDNSSEPCL